MHVIQGISIMISGVGSVENLRRKGKYRKKRGAAIVAVRPGKKPGMRMRNGG